MIVIPSTSENIEDNSKELKNTETICSDQSSIENEKNDVLKKEDEENIFDPLSCDNQENTEIIIEGPIDLSASNTIKTEKTENLINKENIDCDDRKARLQRKPKKRKSTLVVEEEWTCEQIDQNSKPAVSKREEVLKAARSLFSKRTRTLYHWMYPDTSKGKLKAIVSAAWDTLSNTEKEFYISQVLGRFGVPAGSLMVNPQLGGFQNRDPTLLPIASSSHVGLQCNGHLLELGPNVPQLVREEEEYSVPWVRKRWRRRSNPEEHANKSSHQTTAETVDVSYDEDEFADDPELTTELIQFRKAMGNTE